MTTDVSPPVHRFTISVLFLCGLENTAQFIKFKPDVCHQIFNYRNFGMFNVFPFNEQIASFCIHMTSDRHLNFAPFVKTCNQFPSWEVKVVPSTFSPC